MPIKSIEQIERPAAVPVSFPITGRDLEALRQSLGYSVADMCWLFGMSANRWGEDVNDPNSASKPVLDPSVEILARLLVQFPESSPLKKGPSLTVLYSELNSILGLKATSARRKKWERAMVSKKEFAVLLGRQAAGGHRWLEADGGAPAIIQRIAFVMSDQLTRRDPPELPEVVRAWRNLVQEVGKLRGEENVLASGKWNRTTRAEARLKQGQMPKSSSKAKASTKPA